MNQQFDILAQAQAVVKDSAPDFSKSPRQLREEFTAEKRKKYPYYSLVGLIVFAFDELVDELEEDPGINSMYSLSNLIRGIYFHISEEFPGLMVYVHNGHGVSWEAHLGPTNEVYVGQQETLEHEIERILSYAMRNREDWIIRNG